ncbi:pyridoxamine 5'-phosphate oxidase family protein [Spirillospora albida]|uniref:pyridoxamine 5'-phosphate oxidase family protein n=1 Tax=Spirillospora albida TaxID=58123 RepID=UPI00068C7BD7|nr:pyridoxamine 5'-phosphate oxidase family protein [Spirillospora albida]
MHLSRSWRDRLRSAAVLAAAAALGLALLHASLSDGDDVHVPRDLAIGAASLIALGLLRHRYPVGLAFAMTAAQMFSASALGCSAVALFSLAVHRPWRTALPVAAGAFGVLAVVWGVAPIPDDEYREALLVFGLLYGIVVSTGMLVRSRRQLLASMDERARAAEEEQRLRVEEARLLERERIAREMHDVLAHRISLLAVHAGALEFHPDAPAGQREAAGVIRSCAYEAMEDLREVVRVLRDDSPGADRDRPQPALTDVPALLDESRRAGLRVTLDDRVPDPGAIPARIGRHAYRIVQEGLTNARKHAPGAHVRVALTAPGGSSLGIEIVNPLPPGPPPLPLPGAGAGLVGLGERVALLGGALEHGRTGDGRFRLHARLPLPYDHDGDTAHAKDAWAGPAEGMGVHMAADPSAKPVLEELDRAACLALIAPGGIGRVAFEDGEGPTVIPVNYTVENGSVVFRTSTHARLSRTLLTEVAGGGHVRVAFEVDEIDHASEEGWSVLLRGGAHHLAPDERPAAVEPWPGGEHEEWFRLQPSSVSGRRLHH